MISLAIVQFSFEEVRGKTVVDTSTYENNGTMGGGATIVHTKGNCGNAIKFASGAYISIDGAIMKKIPHKAITISLWLKLDSINGDKSIFTTVGYGHTAGQYHFEVNNGIVRWFHRNEDSVEIFSVETGSSNMELVLIALLFSFSNLIFSLKS